MAATVVDSVAVGAADNIATLETGSLTVSGSNRVLWVHVGSGAGTPVDPTSVKWGGSGGTSLTQISTTLDVGSNEKISVWRLISPAATSSTVYVTWPSAQDERWIIAVAVQDADQTTPNGTVATATGTSNTPSVAATSTSGQLVLDFVSFLDTGSDTLTVGAGQTQLENIAGGAFSSFEGSASSTETASGSSTTMSWTISDVSVNGWGIFAFAINDASGGGGPAGNIAWIRA